MRENFFISSKITMFVLTHEQRKTLFCYRRVRCTVTAELGFGIAERASYSLGLDEGERRQATGIGSRRER